MTRTATNSTADLMMVARPELDRFRAFVGPHWSCDLFDAIDDLSADDFPIVHIPETLLVWQGHGPPKGINTVLEADVPHCSLAWAIIRWRAMAGMRGTMPPGW